MPLVTSATHLPAPASAAFALHADVRNLPRLMPPGMVRILHAPTPTRQGDVQVLAAGPGPFARRWVAHIERFQPPHLIADTQRRGPFRHFRHTHLILPDGEGCLLVDVVDLRFFPGPLGSLLDRILVAPALRAMFAYRHRRTRALLEGAAAVEPALTRSTVTGS